MKELYQDIKTFLSNLTEELEAVQSNLERVKTEVAKAERTQQDITRKVTEFQVSAQPKIDKINEILAKYQLPETQDSPED